MSASPPQLLRQRWLLPSPRVQLSPARGRANLVVLRDDLLHPLVTGSKLRKLDAAWGLEVEAPAHLAVATLGGAQSAHAAAVAALAAERGVPALVCLRGEDPRKDRSRPPPVGAEAQTLLFAQSTSYVSRRDYADRAEVLRRARALAAARFGLPEARVAVLEEGCACAAALPGVARAAWGAIEAADGGVGAGRRFERARFVVDSGTGTSAAGLALGAALKSPDWSVVGVAVAETEARLASTAGRLLAEAQRRWGGGGEALGFDGERKDASVLEKGGRLDGPTGLLDAAKDRLSWVKPPQPRRFGAAPSRGDLARVRALAREQGVLLDPVWSLHSWDWAWASAQQEPNVLHVLVHTGGVYNLAAAMQRWPDLWMQA